MPNPKMPAFSSGSHAQTNFPPRCSQCGVVMLATDPEADLCALCVQQRDYKEIENVV